MGFSPSSISNGRWQDFDGGGLAAARTSLGKPDLGGRLAGHGHGRPSKALAGMERQRQDGAAGQGSMDVLGGPAKL